MKKIWLVVPMLFLVAPVLAQEEAPAQEQAPVITRVTGTLLGADEQPMQLAHVHLHPVASGKVVQGVDVAPDGSYALEMDTTGVFRLRFTGVDHLEKWGALLVTGAGGEFQIDAQLSAHTYKEDFSDVAVTGDFNDFSFSKDIRKMEPQADGTYVVEIDVEADSLAYQVINVLERQRSINGTQSDYNVYDGGGDYQSVIAVRDGKARIVFDPDQLMRVDSEAWVRFRDEACVEAQYASFKEGLERQRTDYFDQLRKLREEEATKEALKTFSEEYDWSDSQALIDEAVAETQDMDLRHTLLVTYLASSGKIDSTYARMTLAEIEPASPKWSMGRGLVTRAMYASKQPDVYEDFLYAVLRENPDKDLKSGLLLFLIGKADRDEKEAEKRILFTWLITGYPESFDAQIAKNRYDPNRAIQVGRPVPAFEIASLEDSTVVYSSENMKGQVYLIDFWAVWCGPCIAELPNLHAAYDTYNEDGFTILSLSFDGAPEDVTEYREGEFKMPWLHAFVEDGFSADVAKNFQVLGIPKPILIGQDGSIIATERDLRGEKLDKTLARVFGYEPAEDDKETSESGEKK